MHPIRSTVVASRSVVMVTSLRPSTGSKSSTPTTEWSAARASRRQFSSSASPSMLTSRVAVAVWLSTMSNDVSREVTSGVRAVAAYGGKFLLAQTRDAHIFRHGADRPDREILEGKRAIRGDRLLEHAIALRSSRIGAAHSPLARELVFQAEKLVSHKAPLQVLRQPRKPAQRPGGKSHMVIVVIVTMGIVRLAECHTVADRVAR